MNCGPSVAGKFLHDLFLPYEEQMNNKIHRVIENTKSQYQKISFLTEFGRLILTQWEKNQKVIDLTTYKELVGRIRTIDPSLQSLLPEGKYTFTKKEIDFLKHQTENVSAKLAKRAETSMMGFQPDLNTLLEIIRIASKILSLEADGILRYLGRIRDG